MLVQDFPAKWIYEPWKAPIADQKQANCRIGVDYPKPMVDHASVSKDNIQKLKNAYADQSPSKGKSTSHARSPSGSSPSHARKKQAIRPVGMRVPCVIVQACFFREPYECPVLDVAASCLMLTDVSCAHGHKEEQCHGYCCAPSSDSCSLVAMGWELARRVTPLICLQWLFLGLFENVVRWSCRCTAA